MMIAPEGSFGSAARADAASSGVRDSASPGFAGGRAEFVCFGAGASGFAGAILSSDGAISFQDCDVGGFFVVGVSPAHADKANAATTKLNPSDRTTLIRHFIKRVASRWAQPSNVKG